MIVRLSTSSSNDRLPRGNWAAAWFLSIITFILALIFVEYDIRQSGWKPSVVDSKQLWVHHRKRASELKEKAIILVGASRIQLGLDLDIVRQFTKLEPVQLAIDGSPFMPVLENLALDPSINGIVIISLNENISIDKKSRSFSWVKYYEENINDNSKEPYRKINETISMYFKNNMVTRLEGAKPFTVISSLAFNKQSLGNYLVTHYDRSRDADYNKVKMPEFYLRRVQRHYGGKILNNKVSLSDLQPNYSNLIKDIKPLNNTTFLEHISLLNSLIEKIEDRGGKVVLVRFPTSKLLWEIDRNKFPKDKFWNKLAKLHKNSIHFSDYPSLSKFNLPDGSHLDFRDKKVFTESLINIIFKNI